MSREATACVRMLLIVLAVRRIEKKRNKSSAKFKTPHMYDEVEKQVEPAQGATWKMPLGVSPAKNGQSVCR